MMKNKFLYAATFCFFVNFLHCQSVLPSNYNFNLFAGSGSLPAGWTTNISGTYTYNPGQSGSSGKLDATGEYIQVFTNTSIGTVNYYLSGYNLGGAWQGVFTLEESADGSTWSSLNLHDVTTNIVSLSPSYTNYTVVPNSTSRYLRWMFTSKVSGNNIPANSNIVIYESTNPSFNPYLVIV